MKFCPHCGNELSEQAAFCPNCGKSLNGGFLNLQNLPVKFWLTLVSAVCVALFSFLGWFKNVDDGNKAYNLFTFRDLMKGLRSSIFSWFGTLKKLDLLINILTILAIMLIASFVLLTISLIKYQSSKQALFAYLGFAMSALSSAAFIPLVIYINKEFGEEPFEGLTAFPFVTFVISIVTIIFFVRKPKSVTYKSQ